MPMPVGGIPVAIIGFVIFPGGGRRLRRRRPRAGNAQNDDPDEQADKKDQTQKRRPIPAGAGVIRRMVLLSRRSVGTRAGLISMRAAVPIFLFPWCHETKIRTMTRKTQKQCSPLAAAEPGTNP